MYTAEIRRSWPGQLCLRILYEFAHGVNLAGAAPVRGNIGGLVTVCGDSVGHGLPHTLRAVQPAYSQYQRTFSDFINNCGIPVTQLHLATESSSFKYPIPHSPRRFAHEGLVTAMAVRIRGASHGGLRSRNPNSYRSWADNLGDSCFTLLDVGCSAGIDPVWRLFGVRLRAFGFDTNLDEIARLTAAEILPSQLCRWFCRPAGR